MAKSLTSSTAVAKKPKPEVEQGATQLALLDPNMGKLEALAKSLSKSAVVPMAYIGKPDNIFSTIVYGQNLGVPPMVALNNIASINGKPSPGTDLMLGICQKHPEWGGYTITEHTEKLCKVIVWRWNKFQKKLLPYEGEFSEKDAETAGLLGKIDSPWYKYRKRMLKHRALSFTLRDAFGDALAGMYTKEEMAPDALAAAEEAEFRLLDEIEVAHIEGRAPKIPEPVENKIAPKKAKSKV